MMKKHVHKKGRTRHRRDALQWVHEAIDENKFRNVFLSRLQKRRVGKHRRSTAAAQRDKT